MIGNRTVNPLFDKDCKYHFFLTVADAKNSVFKRIGQDSVADP